MGALDDLIRENEQKLTPSINQPSVQKSKPKAIDTLLELAYKKAKSNAAPSLIMTPNSGATPVVTEPKQRTYKEILEEKLNPIREEIMNLPIDQILDPGKAFSIAVKAAPQPAFAAVERVRNLAEKYEPKFPNLQLSIRPVAETIAGTTGEFISKIPPTNEFEAGASLAGGIASNAIKSKFGTPEGLLKTSREIAKATGISEIAIHSRLKSLIDPLTKKLKTPRMLEATMRNVADFFTSEKSKLGRRLEASAKFLDRNIFKSKPLIKLDPIRKYAQKELTGTQGSEPELDQILNILNPENDEYVQAVKRIPKELIPILESHSSVRLIEQPQPLPKVKIGAKPAGIRIPSSTSLPIDPNSIKDPYAPLPQRLDIKKSTTINRLIEKKLPDDPYVHPVAAPDLSEAAVAGADKLLKEKGFVGGFDEARYILQESKKPEGMSLTTAIDATRAIEGLIKRRIDNPSSNAMPKTGKDINRALKAIRYKLSMAVKSAVEDNGKDNIFARKYIQDNFKFHKLAETQESLGEAFLYSKDPLDKFIGNLERGTLKDLPSSIDLKPGIEFVGTKKVKNSVKKYARRFKPVAEALSMIEEDFKRKQLQSEFEIPSSKRGVIKSAINFFRPTRNIDLARELTQNAIS